jgi:hypothetical protein
LFLQLKHDSAFKAKSDGRLSLFEAFLNELRILTSSDASKGTDKFFKPPKSKSAAPPSSSAAEASETSKEPQGDQPPDSATKQKSTSSNSSKSPPDWNLGMFSPNPSAGPKGDNRGRPIGGEQNPDQSKMIFYGALGFAAVIAALTYFELGYKEISWRDFINK